MVLDGATALAVWRAGAIIRTVGIQRIPRESCWVTFQCRASERTTSGSLLYVGVNMSSAMLADGRQLDARMHVTLFKGDVVCAPPTKSLKRYVVESLLDVMSSEPIRIAGEPTPMYYHDEPHRLLLHVHARGTRMHEQLIALREELLFRLHGRALGTTSIWYLDTLFTYRELPNTFHLSIDGADLRHIDEEFGL